MRPEAYAALYGAARPAPGARRRETGLVLAAGVVWSAVCVLLGWPATLVTIAAVWSAAEGEPVGGFLLGAALVAAAVLVLPVALTFLPPLRHRSLPGRLLLAGTVALPPAVGVFGWALTATG